MIEQIKTIIRKSRKMPLELLFWIGSLVAILLIDPNSSSHFTLCPISQAGFSWCPGCGLGRAMSLLIRGEFQASWDMHPLALLAYVVIISRILNLSKQLKRTHTYG